MQTHSAADAVELVRTVADAKIESQVAPALEMISKMLHENQSASIELAEQGLCGIMDTLLSNRWMDQHMPSRILGIILKMIEDPPVSSASKKVRRRSSGGTSYMDSIIPSDPNQSEDEINKKNVKKVRGFYSGSTTVFRLVKFAPSAAGDELTMTLLLQILITLARCPGWEMHYVLLDFVKMVFIFFYMTSLSEVLGKLISSGICELAAQLLRTTHISNWHLVASLCELIHTLILTDLDDQEGQHRCQEKFAHLQLCEFLISLILQAQATASIELVRLSWAVKLLGTLGRWNEDLKERLQQSGLSRIFPLFTTEILREDSASFLAECLCWCIANVTFPHENLQSMLGDLGVVSTVVTLLDIQRNRPAVIYEACRALRNLCYAHDQNMERVIEQCHGLEQLQVLVQIHEEDAAVLQWIMYALAALVQSDAAIDRLNALGMPSRIVSILRKHTRDADIVQWTALVIGSLASQRDMAEQLAAMNCCEAIAKVISKLVIGVLTKVFIILIIIILKNFFLFQIVPFSAR